MADQPARALVVYGDGLMRFVGPHHSHLHAVAEAGSCGFLALRSLPADSNHPCHQGTERVVSELAQLLDVYDISRDENPQPDLANAGDHPIPSLSDRFMGMKAGMLTNFPPANTLGKQVGFSILKLDEANFGLCNRNDSNEVSPVSKTARHLLASLGLEEGDGSVQKSDFDLLLVHLSANQDRQDGDGEALLSWVDALVGAVQDLSQPGSEASSRLYLVLVLGYGQVVPRSGDAVNDDDVLLVYAPDDKLPPHLAQVVPQQSYTMKGGSPVTDIRQHHPLLVAYNLNAVTRRDDVKAFAHSEFLNHCGNLTILVDHFLHEVAFKLWRAPKYGA